MRKQKIKFYILSAIVISISCLFFACKNVENNDNVNKSKSDESIVNDTKNNNVQNNDNDNNNIEVIENSNVNIENNTENINNNEITENSGDKKHKFSLQDTIISIFGNSSKNEYTSNESEEQTNNENSDEYSKYWSEICDIASFANNYYNNNYSKTRLVTKNGRFYNKASEEYVDINYLIEKGLDSKYADFSGEILLLNPKDLGEFQNVSVKNSQNNLTVFVTMNIQSDDKYLIASSKNSKGVMTSDEYNKLLYKYYQNHGTPLDVNPYSEKYQDILGFIKLYDGAYTDYFVRSMKIDEKYACVVLSPTSNVNDIREYILINEDNFWEVLLNDLHKVSRVAVYVNEKIPDLNFELLPKYEINDYNLNTYDPNDAYYALVKNGYINGTTDIVYICGAGKYYYAIDYKKNRYLLKNEKGYWNIQIPQSYREAYEIMVSDDSFAPTFILLNE